MRAVTLGFALAAIAIGPLSAQAPTEKAPAPPAALDDAKILAMLDKANTAEIELGELAARMGHSSEVRDLGKNFAAAHTTARQKARDLETKLGIPKPADPMKDSTMKYPAQPEHAASLEVSRNRRGSLRLECPRRTHTHTDASSRLGHDRVHAPSRDATAAASSRRLAGVSRGPRARSSGHL